MTMNMSKNFSDEPSDSLDSVDVSMDIKNLNGKNSNSQNSNTHNNHDKESTSAENGGDQQPAEEIIAKLIQENEGLKDKCLRIQADMENLRQRHKRETEDVKAIAVGKFSKDILSVADQLGMALLSCQGSDKADDPLLNAVIEGIKMTDKTLLDVFKKFNIERFESLGMDFNHDLHQAIMEQPSDDYEAGKIMKVLQEGYTQDEKLLRPAMVIVAKSAET
jgi:molecular chaperone GrpE